jgi:hypothetical protein
VRGTPECGGRYEWRPGSCVELPSAVVVTSGGRGCAWNSRVVDRYECRPQSRLELPGGGGRYEWGPGSRQELPGGWCVTSGARSLGFGIPRPWRCS